MAEIQSFDVVELGVVDRMKLVAMMIVRNEADRYLTPCLESLLNFCDEVRVIDDASDDGTMEILASYAGVESRRNEAASFYAHEGHARQALLEWTMQAQPTHILAIDADEFVSDGKLLRANMEEGCATGVWKLRMTEVWKAGEEWLSVRIDGDWSPRPIGVAFAVPPDHWMNRQIRRHWRIHDRALACGRTPLYITMAGNRTVGRPDHRHPPLRLGLRSRPGRPLRSLRGTRRRATPQEHASAVDHVGRRAGADEAAGMASGARQGDALCVASVRT